MTGIKHGIILALATVIVAGCLSCVRGTSEFRQNSGAIWATTYSVTYSSDRDLSDSILTALKQVEMSLSPFADNSKISRINRNESMTTDTFLRRVFFASQEVNRLSCGAFDPTVAPLVNLWGFGYDNSATVPTQLQIDSALSHVGINRCSIVADTMVKCSPLTEFNFSAITKGFGVDMAAETLRRNNVSDFMVEIGGEIVVSGKNPQGEEWHIQIDAPIEDADEISHTSQSIIAITDCAIATSGNYRNFHNTESGKTWHTIDPSTGRPVVTSTLSCTVIAPTCMMADALATACMAMPADKAIAMIDELAETEVMIIEVAVDGNGFIVKKTKGFPKSL